MERYEWARTVRRRIWNDYGSRDDFARKIKYSSGYINNVLCGKPRSADCEAAISEALGIELPDPE